MDLSNDLISKFVKITNDDKNKNSESTVYGTVVEYNGGMYVRIDGSDLLTPVETTADFKPNERVTVMIKNHSATVTGNITSPSTNEGTVIEKVTEAVEDVEGKVITEVEILIADRVSTGQLDAEVARIDELIAGKASVEDLTATNAEITNLKADKASIKDLTATNAEITNLKADKASVEDLTATNAEITNLKAKDAEIENLVADKATIENLTATNARIDSLQANKADITYLDSNFATIDELEAAHADIEILDAEVANINTLVNGNLTSDNILSLNITSQNTTMENAFVKDAMIDTVTANKIMSGTIDTNNVTIQSTDGSMLLQGTLLQMKDDNGKVRIQIGKDTGGNFTFILYDESGTGVLIDEEGIKSSDAIADGLIVDAKVADNANIAGSKLDIASVITEVNNDNSTTIKSNKIYLDEQGQSLEVAFNSLKTQVETIQDVTIDGDLTAVIEQVQSNTTQIAANKEGISTLVSENTIRKEEIQNLDGEIESVNNTLSSKYSSLEQDVSGFKTTVADTYATKQSVTDVSNNLATNYSTTSAMNSAIQQKANEITSSVSETYATKQSVTDVSNNLAANYSTTSAMNSAIQQKANEITSSVSETYTTKSEFNGLQIGGVNLVLWSECIELHSSDYGNYYNSIIENNTVKITPTNDGNVFNNAIYTSETRLQGETYTLSFDILSPDDIGFYWYPSESYSIDDKINASSKWQTVSFTYTQRGETTANPVLFGFHRLIAGHVYYYRRLKLEKGNKPTAWSPAPEDIQGQIDATNNNLTNNYSTTTQMNSAIQQKANEITSTVSQTYTTKSEFNNLQIGGKNLLLDSKREITNNEYLIGSFRPTELFEVGEQYTVSICVTPANGVGSIKPFISGGYMGLSNPLYVNGTTRQVLSITFTFGGYASDKVPVDASDSNADVQFYRLPNDGTVTSNTTLHWVKVEKGAKATDWTPAPEDVQGQIDDTNANLQNNYSTTSAMNSAIQQKANEITSSVSQTYTTKSEFNNLQIGGTNTFKISKVGSETCDIKYNSSFTDNSENGFNVITADGRMHTRLFHTIKDNGYWTVSFKVKSSVYVGPIHIDICDKVADSFNSDTNWSEVTRTVLVDNYSVDTFNFVDIVQHIDCGQAITYYFKDVKVEKGNKPTAWSPAPEDVQGQIDATNNNLTNNYSTTTQMNSAIQQKANEITSSVSQTYTTKAEFNNLAIGGTNLYPNSNFITQPTYYEFSGHSLNVECASSVDSGNVVAKYGGNVLMLYTNNADDNYYTLAPQVTLEPNTTYTLSYDYASTGGISANSSYIYLWGIFGDYNTRTVISAGDGSQTHKVRKRYKVTFTTADRVIMQIRFGFQNTSEAWMAVEGIKLEKGNQATEWSPAPEDVQGQIDATNNNLAVNYSTTSQMNSAIQQKANEITSSVSETYTTKSEFNNLQIGGTNLIQNGNFKGAIAGSTSMPDPWTFWGEEIRIYWSHGLPGYNHVGCVYIGCNLTDGRQSGMFSNVIHVSKVEKGANYMASFIFAIEHNVKGATAHLEYLNDARDQILHSQVLATARVTNNVVNGLHEHQYHIPFTMWTGDFSYIQIVFNHRGTNVPSNGYLMIVGNVQIEKGNKATDWSPAPEDVQGQIDATNANLQNNYSTTSQMNSAIQQKANEITSSVSETYATKQSVTDVSNNLATNYSTTSQMNSAIQQKANEITSSVSQTYTTKAEFNNLEVGGTNLIYNGGFNRNLDNWNSNGNSNGAQACGESPSGYMLCIDASNDGHGVYQVLRFHDSTYCTDYVVSFYAKTNVDGSRMFVSMEGDPATSSVFTLNGGWQKCVYKFRRSNPGTNAIVFYASGGGTRNIYIHSIKMEKGTVPSAWSPHPSEIENKVNDLSNNLANNYSTTTQMNSAIQQKANEITSSVSQTYITKAETSLMNDTVAGNRKWLFEMYTNNQQVGTGGGTYPTLAHLANETLISSRLVDSLPGHTSEIGDFYIGVYTVYLYYESAYTWSGSITSDDESTTYLNGVAVCQAPTCVTTPFTMNFKKGINKLQIIHGEGGGGDGVTLSDLGPWKEFGAYPACVTAASSNHYASNSDIVQTANDLTIKFTESGGYNLLQNGHADKGTSYWVNNGGGLNHNANAGGGATGNFFGTDLPHGISYHDWVKLLPNTHYVYQAKIWSNAAFGGLGSAPLHYWFSYDAANGVSDGYTILDYQQNVPHTGTWTQCYVHFVTGNSNIFFKPIIWHNGVTTSIFVTELMLSQSRVVQPWSPHPSEVYSGITQIDKDGIRVHHSNANSYTHMAPDGFFVNNNGTDVVQVTASGLYVQGNITSGSTIQGARITGSTFNSSNDVFQVLEDGTIETSYLAVNGAVSTDKLNVNDIENASYPKVLTEATTVYISPNGGVNAEEFYDGAYFTSLSNMLSVAPRNLNGYTLTIKLMSDLYENAALTWFHSGQVNFEMQGNTIFGYFYGYGPSMCYRLYGNTNANSSGAWGHIKPNVGRAMGGYYYAVQFQYCQFAINNIAVYPSASSGSSSGGIGVHRGATGIIFNAKACGDMKYLVRAEYAGRVHVNATQGACNNATFCATTGGIITLNSSNNQAGRSTTGNPYWVGSGGLILCDQLLGMDKITFNNTSQSGSSSSSGSSTRKVTETVKATSADTYRSTVYNNWKGDSTVRQGDYGYGDCQGCWFFGNNLYTTMNAGTVTKVVIRIQRQSGGVNALQTLTVKSHNHTSRPSGAPTYTDTIGTCSCAVGSSIDLVITDSATINKLKKCKGLGLSIGSASSPYAVCSGACSVIITYTTNS